MPRQKQIKTLRQIIKESLIATGILASTSIASIYGIETYLSSKSRELESSFPTYVERFEKKYGPFNVKPSLKFGHITTERLVIARADPNGVVTVNNDPLLYLMNCTLFGCSKEDIIPHELGHLFMNKMIEKFNPNWITIGDKGIRVSIEMRDMIKTIGEGVAEYIGNNNGGYLKNNYSNYYSFVKPVLDNFGLEEGIKRLLLEPPTYFELKNPVVYYKRLAK